MAKNRKSKGMNSERELVHMLWSRGIPCIRVAGSGSSKYPSPDLIIGTANGKLAVEVKATSKEPLYISKEQIDDLVHFSGMFGADPWIAVRIDCRGWVFTRPKGLSGGKSFKVSFADDESDRFWDSVDRL